jgi:uncharacterized spore protein YtfJ
VQVLLGHAVPPELNEGTTPSTIARKVGVGYATVARIAATKPRHPVGACVTGQAYTHHPARGVG